MPQHIFFSWQSDVPTIVGRNLIERSLERAIGVIQADAEIDPADRDLRIDRDTLDVPGSPPILETIFGKIDRASVFLSDLTNVATRPAGGLCPNPNVCIEHGYALKALTWRRVIAVMNSAFGDPEKQELPFDLRHARRPILFDCAADADADMRRRAREDLTAKLVVALRVILADEEARAALQPAAPAEPHPHDLELLDKVRRQLSLDLRRFLRQHSFGTPFRFAVLDPLHEMNADWVGAAYEFHDPELQASFGAMRHISEKFGSLIFERIYAIDGNPKMGWPKTDQDIRDGIQPTTHQAIAQMNSKAHELSDAIDAFDRLARDRVRVASGVHADASAAAMTDLRREAALAALQEITSDALCGRRPELVSGPRVTLRLIPFAATEGRRLDPIAVGQAQLRFPPPTAEKVFTDSDGRQWWSCGPRRRPLVGANPETSWRMRLVRPGYLEYQETAGHRIDDDRDIGIDGRILEAVIVRNLERMAKIADELGLAGAALIQISLEEMEDVTLTRARPGGRRIRTPAVNLPLATLSDLSKPIAPLLREQLDILWQASGWSDGSPSFAEDIWDGYTNDNFCGS